MRSYQGPKPVSVLPSRTAWVRQGYWTSQDSNSCLESFSDIERWCMRFDFFALSAAILTQGVGSRKRVSGPIWVYRSLCFLILRAYVLFCCNSLRLSVYVRTSVRDPPDISDHCTPFTLAETTSTALSVVEIACPQFYLLASLAGALVLFSCTWVAWVVCRHWAMIYEIGLLSFVSRRQSI